EFLHPEVLEHEIELSVDLLVDGLRDADAAGRGDGLQSRRDIHAVAVDAVILDDHVPQVHADPGLDPLGWFPAGVAGRLRILNRLRTAHGVDHAVELPEDGVTRSVDDTSLMGFDDTLCAVMEFADERRGPFFVPPHHAAEARDVDHEDGRELTTRCGSFCRHDATIMPSGSRESLDEQDASDIVR